MAGFENQPEVKPDMMVHINGNCGLNNLTEMVYMINVPPETNEPNAGGFKRKFIRILIFGLCFLIVFGLGLVVGRYILPYTYPSEIPPCSQGWIRYDRRCYYFSDTEGTWDFSQRNCSLNGASLTAIDTQQQMNFLLRYKGAITDHWIGLWRKTEEQPWQWTNGSIFSGWFRIGANGLCAYLNDEEASSTWCTTERNWICSKPVHTA